MSGAERSLDRASPGRRGVLSMLGGVLLTGALTGCKGQDAAAAAQTALPDRKDSEELTWKEARKILEEGNARFLEGKKTRPSGTDVDALVTAITPAVHEAEELGAKGEDMLTVAVDNNVERVVEQLNDAKVIAVAVKSRKLKVLGATYDLETGEVTFS